MYVVYYELEVLYPVAAYRFLDGISLDQTDPSELPSASPLYTWRALRLLSAEDPANLAGCFDGDLVKVNEPGVDGGAGSFGQRYRIKLLPLAQTVLLVLLIFRLEILPEIFLYTFSKCMPNATVLDPSGTWLLTVHVSTRLLRRDGRVGGFHIPRNGLLLLSNIAKSRLFARLFRRDSFPRFVGENASEVIVKDS